MVYSSGVNTAEGGINPSLEKLIQLAELLDTTMDYLLMGNSNNGSDFHDTRLAKRFQELENFQIEDKEAVIRMLDGMIIKNRTHRIMTMDDNV